VHVIWHDCGGVKEVLKVVVVQTALQRDGTSDIRQDPSMKCAEGHEVALVITLQMRELASVECHQDSCRDSCLGCPVERSKASNRLIDAITIAWQNSRNFLESPESGGYATVNCASLRLAGQPRRLSLRESFPPIIFGDGRRP
jgi:hypothetical protein